MKKTIIGSVLLVGVLLVMSGCFGGSIPKKPGAPTNLIATGTSYQSMTLTWKDNSNNETGFKIYCSYWETWGYDLVGEISKNATSAIHSGLDPLETYYYYIESYNSAGSSRSNIAKGITQSGVEILNHHLGEKYGDAYITGQAKNITDMMMDSITITAWLYDAAGILLDTTSDYASDVPPQTTYNFDIWAYNVPLAQVARYDIEVTNVWILEAQMEEKDNSLTIEDRENREKSLTPDQFLKSDPDRLLNRPYDLGAFLKNRK